MHKRTLLRDILILFAISLIPVFWFKPGCFIASGDVAQYLDISNLMRFFPWAWEDRIAAGEPGLSNTFSLPYGYFWLLLKSAGIGLIAIEKAWVFLTFFASAMSMHIFMRGFSREKGSLAPLAAAVFYVYNLFLVVAPLIVQYNLAPLYMFCPLTLSFWSRGLQAEGARKRVGFAALFALSSLLYTHSNVNVPHVAAFVIIVAVFTLYHLLLCSRGILADIRFMIIAMLLYLLINCWWMVSSLSVMLQMSDQVQGTRSGWHLLWATRLYEAFRFLGFWAWTHKHFDVPYFPYHPSYGNWFFILLSYGIAFFALCAVFARKRIVLFPLLLLVVGLFFVKGGTGPFGFVYEYCWHHLKGFWIFREPWSKFTHVNVFAFAVLFGIGSEQVREIVGRWAVSGIDRAPALVHSLKKPLFAVYPLLLLSAVLLNAYPAVTGEVIWDQVNHNVRSMQVKVPLYWPQVGKWFLKNDPHARVFLLPKTGYSKGPYDWESGFTSASTAAISYLPNQLAYWTDFPTTRAQLLFNRLFEHFRPGKSEGIGAVLKTLGVKYILQQNDILWRFTWPDAIEPAGMKAMLGGIPAISLKETFGKLDLYEVKDPGGLFSFAPTINVFSGAEVDLFNAAAAGWGAIPYTTCLNAADAGALKAIDPNVSILQSEEVAKMTSPAEAATIVDEMPVRKIGRVNPTKYILHVEARSPFWIVFNETFHPGWRARIREKQADGILAVIADSAVLPGMLLERNSSTPVEAHVRLNDYANGWFVGKTGAYDLIIEYRPQGRYEAAKLLAWCAGIFCCLLIMRGFSLRKDPGGCPA